MTSEKRGVSSGLGRSTPLVTIPQPGSITHGVAVPAGNNHPLAANIPVVQGVDVDGGSHSAVPAAPVLYTNTPVGMAAPTRSMAPVAQTMATPSRPPPTTAAPTASSVPSARVIPSSVSPPKSLESLADMFLCEPSYRTEALGLPPIVRPPPLPHEDGVQRLRTLVDRRAWGDVLKISAPLLTAPTSPYAAVYASLVIWANEKPAFHVPAITEQIQIETAEIMTLQCHAWLKLRRYTDLTTEVERWNFVQYNDATAKAPEWLPWSLQILAAQIQQYADDPVQASDLLSALRQRISDDEPIWLANLDSALTNCFLRQGEWRLALGSLDRILELIPKATQYEIDNVLFCNSGIPDDRNAILSVLTTAYRCEILSRQGRILLQIGALPEVEQRFETVTSEWTTAINSNDGIPSALERHHVVEIMSAMVDANQGLLAFAHDNYEHSLECFRKATETLRMQGTPLDPQYRIEDWMGPSVTGSEARHSVFTECINNMGLCALYTCRLNEAVQLMESLVREDPTAFLTERLAFNLCTLYELGSDSAASARKKRVLQFIAKRFFLHDIGPESFRVN